MKPFQIDGATCISSKVGHQMAPLYISYKFGHQVDSLALHTCAKLFISAISFSLINLKVFFCRMKDESLVKVCTLPSAGKEVVTSLMTGLIDLAVDKVAVDKVAVKNGSDEKVSRKANFVQRKSLEMKAGGNNETLSKERLEKAKASSGSKTPTWVEDPNLPPGWKSCVAGDWAKPCCKDIREFLISPKCIC